MLRSSYSNVSLVATAAFRFGLAGVSASDRSALITSDLGDNARIMNRDMLHSHAPSKAFFDVAAYSQPPSYFYLDFGDDPDEHSMLMVSHIALMTIAWFGFLPLSLYLRTAKHPLHHVVQVLFLLTSLVALICARLYKLKAPDLYEGQKHGPLGWLAIALAAVLCAFGSYRFLSNAISRYKNRKISSPSLPAIFKDVISYRVVHDMQDVEQVDRIDEETRRFSEDSSITLNDQTQTSEDATFPPSTNTVLRPALISILKFSHIFALRTLVVLGYVPVLSGSMIYSGKCRGSDLNGCLGHLIKASIFLLWAFLSFARYLGAWSEIGWAWNIRPSSTTWRQHAPSAEFVECSVMAIYGYMNMFLKRVGYDKNAPYSHTTIEHISIDALFAFVGTLGVILEADCIRRYLVHGLTRQSVDAPAYQHSMNPFPALITAVTGIVMSGHHQDYEFQGQMHVYWGRLLVGFGVCRILTYLSIWTRPLGSTVPSRPPTEVLGTFFLGTGAFMFILSTKPITYGLMSVGLDKIMMVLNASFGIIALCFSWLALLTAIKGWACSQVKRVRHIESL